MVGTILAFLLVGAAVGPLAYRRRHRWPKHGGHTHKSFFKS
jgi:hypothetical protein